MANSSRVYPVVFDQMSTQGKVSDLSGATPIQKVDSETFDSIKRQIETVSFNSQAASLKRQEGSNLYGVSRSPWVFATFEDITSTGDLMSVGLNRLPDTSIVWAANPKSVSWQISQRGSETKNKSGTVLHMWRDRLRKTDYDDPKIVFQFNSGNILPSVTDGINSETQTATSPPDRQMSEGLRNFYQFLKLVDQPKISKSGQANLIHILYKSRIFPAMVITGFFDPQLVIQFQDDSQNPNQISGWQATFTVYSTTPQINDFEKLVGIFDSEGFEGFKGK